MSKKLKYEGGWNRRWTLAGVRITSEDILRVKFAGKWRRVITGVEIREYRNRGNMSMNFSREILHLSVVMYREPIEVKAQDGWEAEWISDPRIELEEG